ncbi:MAG: hypothetical protein DHS20C16_00070 [Phycisphaerae bacterium]|nr:MAG: hypothetical protein DHS20C16_00070 [Phycisphaerae bacterium]
MIDQIVAFDRELLRCPSCDYMIHEDGHDRCPECGIDIDMRAVCEVAIDANRSQFKILWYTHVAELPLDKLCCVKCDYRLVGLSTNRCPECGIDFDWDTVCDAAIAKAGNLFEYQWFADPLKSLARTFWLGATSPFRLWSTYSKSDTPRVFPLVFLILIQWLIFARGWHAVALAMDPLMNKVIAVLPGIELKNMRFTYGARYENADLVDYAMWFIATFLTLTFFVQSNREHNAHWRQVLRVFAHSTILASFCTALWCVLEAVLDSSLYFWPWPKNARSGLPRIESQYYFNLGYGVMGLALVSVWAMLWIGYRKYLRIPHGWAIAGVALFVGHLVTRCVRILLAWE